MAEVGKTEEAVAVLCRAAELSPNAGHEKFMYLSQLTEGEASLGHSRRGIEILRREVAEEAARGSPPEYVNTHTHPYTHEHT